MRSIGVRQLQARAAVLHRAGAALAAAGGLRNSWGRSGPYCRHPRLLYTLSTCSC